MRSIDELIAEQRISDATWATLAESYDVQQLLDVVYTVGQYFLVTMAANTVGVERDDGVNDVRMPT